jgi:hypothetical protein
MSAVFGMAHMQVTFCGRNSDWNHSVAFILASATLSGAVSPPQIPLPRIPLKTESSLTSN